MVTASAPGKFILFGEHAVVYGKTAVAVAMDRRFACSVAYSDENTLNGKPVSFEKHPYIYHMLQKHGMDNTAVDTVSDIPAGSGLGSSAALSVSFSAAIRALKGMSTEEKDIAEDAFDTEYSVQGRASPADTSTCTHGSGISINGPGNGGLWSISRNGNVWHIADAYVPEMTIVVGHTGIHAATGPLVERVRKFRDKNGFAYDIVNEIGDIALHGIDLMRKNDITGIGELMTKNHKLLSILGVSCSELNKLVNAALPYSYGAKLTGAGGGGSMIALTDEPDKVCEAISKHGGTPFVVKTAQPGVVIKNI